MWRRNIAVACLVMTAVSTVWMDEAQAYFDPGTGSMILQALLTGALAMLAFGKYIYAYIQRFFRRGSGDDDNPGTSAGGNIDAPGGEMK